MISPEPSDPIGRSITVQTKNCPFLDENEELEKFKISFIGSDTQHRLRYFSGNLGISDHETPVYT